MEDATEAIYLPSILFMFNRTRKVQNAVICNEGSEELVKNKVLDGVIIYNQSDDSEGLLKAIQRIGKMQPIRDLFILSSKCEKLQEEKVFHMSKTCEFIALWDCVLPSSTLNHLFQQISACSTLHVIDIRKTDLGDMESLSLRNLPSLTKLSVEGQPGSIPPASFNTSHGKTEVAKI